MHKLRKPSDRDDRAMQRILTVAVVTALAVAMAMPASAEIPGDRDDFVMVFFQPDPSTNVPA